MRRGFLKIRSAHRAGLSCLATAVVVTTLAATTTPAAAAPSYSVSASIAGSGCTSQTSRIHWWGSNNYQATMKYQPKGDVYVCWTKYRLSDSDPHGDYYSMVATSTWRFTAGGARYFEAAMNQSIDSNVRARDNVYGSTPTFTSSKSCSTPFTVSYSIGIFSASTSPKVCSSYKVTRVSGSGSGGFWTAKNAGELQVVETSLTQKVAQGVVPRFTVSFGVPQYTHTYNGNNYVPSAHLVYQSFTGK